MGKMASQRVLFIVVDQILNNKKIVVIVISMITTIKQHGNYFIEETLYA